MLEYTAQGVFQLPWERVVSSRREHVFLIDKVDEMVPTDAQGQAQLFVNQDVRLMRRWHPH